MIIGDADFRCFWVAHSCFATSSVFAKKPKNLKKPKKTLKNLKNLKKIFKPRFFAALNVRRETEQSKVNAYIAVRNLLAAAGTYVPYGITKGYCHPAEVIFPSLQNSVCSQPPRT